PLSLLRALRAALAEGDHVDLMYRFSRIRRRRWFERVDDPRFDVSIFHDRGIPVVPRGLEVVHGPDLRMPRVSGVPAVSTVHDLSALDLEGVAGEDFRKKKRATLADVASRAAVILCVSEFTEVALLRRHPQAAGRTRVVAEGLAERFGPHAEEGVAKLRRARGLARPY